MKTPKLSKFTQGEIPHRAGQRGSLSHVLGENPRKANMSASVGTNPSKTAKRFGGGMTQHTAPHKHEMGLIDPTKISFGFGGPGSTDPT